jgi:hypothetical protein
MITNTGKDIIAKFLIGQAPAYASFIAIGSGAKPLGTLEDFDRAAYAEKENLDFEMFRVPITSRGYVTDIVDGLPVSKVVFTAELPSEQRYEISEVGVYSAKSNPSATARDSRILYTFTDTENWEYHTENSATGLGPVATKTLAGDLNDDIIKQPDLSQNPVFRATTDNGIFNSAPRTERFERCRYLSNKIFIPGDTSFLESTGSGSAAELSVKQEVGQYHGTHVHLFGVNLDLGKNSPEDEIRLAFSIVNKDGGGDDPERIMVLLEFASDDNVNAASYAKFQVDITEASPNVDLHNNRYYVVKKKISELPKSNNFSWSTVNTMRMYVSVMVSGVPSEDYYVVPDAIRFENTTTKNPLYGLTGYSVVKSSDGSALIKEANTSNLVEFRFGLDVA